MRGKGRDENVDKTYNKLHDILEYKCDDELSVSITFIMIIYFEVDFWPNLNLWHVKHLLSSKSWKNGNIQNDAQLKRIGYKD